jgi:hypothetical protein
VAEPAGRNHSKLDDQAAGRGSAQWLWDHWPDEGSIEERLTPAFTSAAVAELARLRHQRTAGVLSAVLRGAERSAEQLNVESFHGLVEIVQNADDVGATSVNLAFRKSGRVTNLLVAHDGERVHLPDVLAMTLAFVTTKADDPRTKGKFGIGLKTLGRLGSRLAVHSPPYHYAIEAADIAPERPVEPVRGLYGGNEGETLLGLRLHQEFDLGDFLSWLSTRGASWLMFLDSVRHVRLIDLRSGKTLIEHRLIPDEAEEVHLSLATGRVRGERRELREAGRRRSWTRYTVELPVPEKQRRTYKATGPTTTLGMAIASDQSAAPLYAGLPLEMPADLPFALNAQFDPDTARRTVLDIKWNDWLFNRVSDLVGGVAISRFQESTASGWAAVPMLGELPTRDEWLHQRAARMVEMVQDRLRAKLRLPIGRTGRRLRDLVYEATPMEGLLSDTDEEALAPGLHALPADLRDRQGRWREVLGEIGESRRLEVSDALGMFDWDDEALGSREGSWFVRMIGVALEAQAEGLLRARRCLLTRGGRRFAPTDVGSRILLVAGPDNDLAARLQVSAVLDRAFLSRAETARRVRAWLQENELIASKVSNDALLELLADWDEDDPIPLSDRDLADLRNALESVSVNEAERLGEEIGDRVLVRGYRYEGGKKVSERVAPGDAYRPSALDKRRDAWAVAAGRTSGIRWIDSRYESVLRSKRKTRGAAALFKLLGAEVAPRLFDNEEDVHYRHSVPATFIDRSALPTVQQEKLQDLPTHRSTHLRHDTVAPELGVVMTSIASERVAPSRRKRARALVKTLEGAWDRLYANFTKASVVYSDYNWVETGEVTATWLAVVMNEPWLTNRRGRKKTPRELAVRTASTVQVYGDDTSLFAYELDAEDARHPLIPALGIEGDPRVSGIVEELVALREAALADQPWDPSRPQLLYTALAAHCPREVSVDGRVDDLTVRQLRARFGQQRDRPGLIYAEGKWLPPARVFRGPTIFGGRRAFVPRASRADALWRTLGVETPGPEDCLDVLREIAVGSLDPDEEYVLLETYRYLAGLLDKLPRKVRRGLTELPLWSGSEWLPRHPVYAVHDGRVAEGLRRHVPVWRPPGALGTLGELVEALGVTVLPESSFVPVGIHAAAAVEGRALSPRFAVAVEHLRTYLAEHDDNTARGFERWRELATAALMVSPELAVDVPVGRRRYEVPTDAHLVDEPLALYLADADELGDADSGGRLVASLFDVAEPSRVTVGLAWERAWRRAEAHRPPERSVHLASEPVEADLPPGRLGVEGRGVKRSRERFAPREGAALGSGDGSGGGRPLVRQLKPLEAIQPVSVDVIEDQGRPGAVRPVKRGGLKTAGDALASVPAGRPAPRGALKAFTPEERETLGFRVMEREIRARFSTEVNDCRDQQGVGADAIDDAQRYFELKAHEGEMPDEETLSGNQAEQAIMQRGNYYLVVVSGLEQGYDTRVRFIRDPVHVLDLRPGSSVVLAGIRTAGETDQAAIGTSQTLRATSEAPPSP